jgi:hypothetical protein
MAWRKVFIAFVLLTSVWAKDTAFKQACFEYQGHDYTLLRSFVKSQKSLLVDNHKLTTILLPSNKLSTRIPCKKDSHYEQLRSMALSQSKTVANRGMKKGFTKGYALTVDMCPSSKKGFERSFYEALIKKQKAYPVTISMTKKWAIYHPKAFAQLKAWDDNRDLQITWMNHGSWHPYERGVAIEKNFINLEGVDFTKEVLDNENFLIKEGRVPSIFYRFAGLVSNDKAFAYLIKELGLIPVGSKAWLAKGETIQKGSIVLLHGNKNEPLGIQRFNQSKIDIPVVNLPQLFIED